MHMRADFLATNQNGNKYVVEMKYYRSRFVENRLIYNAVEQVSHYKKALEKNYKKVEGILVVSCQVLEEVKQLMYEQYQVQIIDVSNLLYLCQDDKELMKELNQNVLYAVDDIAPIKPAICDKKQEKEGISLKKDKFDLQKKQEDTLEVAVKYIERLERLRAGREGNVSRRYEELCVEIIQYLFGTEFTQMSDQHKTKDNMFRMDLICGLKGSTAFWKLLINHYNTRFVVFEFKNYSTTIEQNLIYITEKYLFNAALRNVAIILSRKGFSNHAYDVAIGALKEDSKLIMDVNDEDLIAMLKEKLAGREPSDYLLTKLETILMSISK